MPIRESAFEQAIELFYEAAIVPDLWPEALAALGFACGAAGAALYPFSPSLIGALSSTTLKEYIADLVAGGWNGANSRMRRGLELTLAGMKGLITDRDMFTPAELTHDRFFNEFIRPHGMGATAGMVMARWGDEFVLPMALERRASEGPFERSEVRKMNRLAARLQPAARLALRAGFMAARSIADTLSDIGREVALIGPSGRVIHMPRDFERHFGSALTMSSGLLGSPDREADAALKAAILRAAAGAPTLERATPPIRLPRTDGRPPLVAQVVPITGKGQDLLLLARAVLIVVDPLTARSEVTRTLQTAFGLTPAEARLASRIGAGETLRDAAGAEAISLETARSRLKVVFGKTRTHRQAELALLLAGLLAS
ncbi:MAG: hypothetical protein J0H94_16890 [Rhizobiales bacterium]|nr:hypothetical protein [Hyphomicrobiales bacterium]